MNTSKQWHSASAEKQQQQPHEIAHANRWSATRAGCRHSWGREHTCNAMKPEERPISLTRPMPLSAEDASIFADCRHSTLITEAAKHVPCASKAAPRWHKPGAPKTHTPAPSDFAVGCDSPYTRCRLASLAPCMQSALRDRVLPNCASCNPFVDSAARSTSLERRTCSARCASSTAVSKPKHRSTSKMSLSMDLGMPMTAQVTPSCNQLPTY